MSLLRWPHGRKTLGAAAIQVRFESDSRAIRMNLERFGRIGIAKTQYFGAIRPSPVFLCIILKGEKGGRIGLAVKQFRFLEFSHES